MYLVFVYMSAQFMCSHICVHVCTHVCTHMFLWGGQQWSLSDVFCYPAPDVSEIASLTVPMLPAVFWSPRGTLHAIRGLRSSLSVLYVRLGLEGSSGKILLEFEKSHRIGKL